MPALALSAIIADCCDAAGTSGHTYAEWSDPGLETREETATALLRFKHLGTGSSLCGESRIHVCHCRGEDDVNQASIVDGLVKTDAGYKAGAIARETLPVSNVTPASIVGSDAPCKASTFLGDEAAVDGLTDHCFRSRLKQRGGDVVDFDDASAVGFKDDHWHPETQLCPLPRVSGIVH